MWSPQQYISAGKQQGISDEVLNNAIQQVELVSSPPLELPSILSLNHLAARTKVPYLYLRAIVGRNDYESYKKFSIKKRSGGRRFIHVPAPKLMYVQRWINTHILKKVATHPASFAFAEGSSILKCANRHSGAKWLIKMDIMGFFESVSEIQAFRVFKGLGYQPLVAFELARICTAPVRDLSPRKHIPSWKVRKPNEAIYSYNADILGYLPQGAATSPMLSNLVMKEIDEKIQSVAKKYQLTYTRYSDDLTFSTRQKDFGRNKANSFVAEISKILAASGFKPQHRKTNIVPPGSRKIVLGLQVDGDQPKLRREFKDLLRQHIYYLEKYGIVEHAGKRGFDSVWGMKCHIRGLIDFANMIEHDYAASLLKRFNALDWPT